MAHQLREKIISILLCLCCQFSLALSYVYLSYVTSTMHNPSRVIINKAATKRISFIKQRPLQYSFANSRRSAYFLHRLCSPPPIRSSVIALSTQSSDNYYTSASSISTSSPSSTFPKWWSESADPSSSQQQEYIKFEHHVAHVIVPNITDITSTKSRRSTNTTTCGEIIQWVLKAEKDRKQHQITTEDAQSQSTSSSEEQLRIQVEYKEGEEVSTSLKVLDPAYRHDPSLYPQDSHNNTRTNLNAAQLLALGSVWYLPLSSSIKSSIDRFDPQSGSKPTRLNIGGWNKTIKSGEYFRIHFDPRRFIDTNLYDWGTADGLLNETSDKMGVIVARDDEAGYIIINKPCNIPVHARVDNVLENVASSIGRMLWLERRESLLANNMNDDIIEEQEDEVVTVGNHTYTRRRRRSKQRKNKVDPLVYVATPQRLDQNTSGLLVVGTKKTFAAYFAKLLRTKTSGQLKLGGSNTQYSSNCGVHKTYKCLVCISPQASTSMASEVNRLKGYTNEIMKHYLEPSIRAPKRFVETLPTDVDTDNVEAWAECLLRITNVTAVCTVVGNEPSDTLAKSLWGEYGKPDECVGMAELVIELLTGRTHQIRGQLAAMGFPLVGDVQYDGAVPNTSKLYKERCKGRVESFLDSERLALQCCSLEFLDPNHEEPSSDNEKQKKSKRSQRWNKFRLENAFWSPFISQFAAKSKDQ